MRTDEWRLEYDAVLLVDSDVPYLLSLVERLMEFVPVPKLVGTSVGIAQQCPILAWEDIPQTVGGSRLSQLLTACEVHGIEPPAWLVQRASDAG